MMKSLYAALAAVLMATPAFAQGGAGYTVNISTTSETLYTDRITEVVIVGEGTYTYPDPHVTPLLSQPELAIQTALDELGLPMGTTASPQGTTVIGTDETFESSYVSNCNPTDHPDCVIGDPEDYLTWIAVGNTNVDVYVTQVTTEWTYHQMTAGIDEPCDAGSYSATGNEPCTPCSAGSYQPSTGQTSCLSCAAGSFSPTNGATLCLDCSAGYTSNPGSASCESCEAGTYSDMPGSPECTDCSAGYHASNMASTSCSACDAGEFSAAGSAECSQCSAGTYSASGSAGCSFCGTGTFSGAGSGTCSPCPAGTFNSVIGQASCQDCGAGTFQLNQGSQVCDPCPGGQATPCNGNGVCSDGPTGNGTCSCNVGYSGFACENGPPTTTVTTTTSTTSTTLAGPCSALPLSGCVVAAKAGFQISKKTDPAKSKMKWKLGGGSLAVAYPDLGDPTMSTTWTLCVYDSTGGTPYLSTLVALEPSSTGWTGKDPKGWKYKDKDGAQLGVTGVSLGAGVAGKTKAQVKGGGASLPLPVPVDMTKYFEQGSTVTVQLVKEGGPGADVCWTSEFDVADTKLNTPASFKATAK